MSGATSPPAQLLLVEDDEELRATLCDGLVERGHLVTSVASAEQALEHLRVTEFDLLITDYQLGGATGTWLARVAARTGQLSAPRVLLLTAYDDLADAEGIEVVRKPFDFDDFLTRVEEILLARRSQLPSDVPPPAQRIAFTLYVNDAPASVRATRNLNAVVAAYRPNQIALTIVNVSTQLDHHAEEDRVMVTPTLVKTFPAPRTWIVGDLDRREIVTRVLEQAGVERR